MSEEQTAQELKELGNAAVKSCKYEEAVLHYTHAIKLEPSNFVLYSNRSYAFFKIQQHYNAMEDANETIRLNPTGAKGYFRKAEVEYATYHFADAIKSYELALYNKPGDENIIESISLAQQELYKDMKANAQIPWVGAGVGLILGVTLLILDYLFAAKPTHPLLMAIVTITISMVGYGLAKAFRYFVISQRNSLLEPPPTLWETDEDKNENDVTNKTKPGARFTKSQARQRYKKGKL